MPGLHKRIQTKNPIEIGNTIIPATNIRYWNHGEKTQVSFQVKNKKFKKKIINISTHEFEKIINNKKAT